MAAGTWGKYDGGAVSHLEKRLAAIHGVRSPAPVAAAPLPLNWHCGLKVGPGAEVILSGPSLLPGNFLSILAVGGLPVLVDIDPDNWNLALEGFAPAVPPPRVQRSSPTCMAVWCRCVPCER